MAEQKQKGGKPEPKGGKSSSKKGTATQKGRETGDPPPVTDKIKKTWWPK